MEPLWWEGGKGHSVTDAANWGSGGQLPGTIELGVVSAFNERRIKSGWNAECPESS